MKKSASFAELIIVNDGSIDALTIDVIEQARREGIRVIDQPNSGLAKARNAGINEAIGKYVLPLDADNRLCSEYLGAGLEVLEREPAVGIVYSNRALFGERHEILKVREFDLSWLLMANFIDACAIFRRSVWEQCNGYSIDMPVQGYEDWDLWIRAAANGWSFKHLNVVGFEYRVRTNSMSATMTPRVEFVREYLVKKYSHLYAKEYYRFGLWETPAREFRRRPFYVLSQLIVRAWFPTLLKRRNRVS